MNKNNWKGTWIIAIAVIHTIFALISFGPVYRDMIKVGLINSVASPMSAAASWFFLFGILILVVGLMISAFEKQAIMMPKSVGITLLVLTILGVIVMPASGFWLLFPPVLLMLNSGAQS